MRPGNDFNVLNSFRFHAEASAEIFGQRVGVEPLEIGQGEAAEDSMGTPAGDDDTAADKCLDVVRLSCGVTTAASLERITSGAVWADARLGFGYLPLLDGCAVVSDIGWIRAPTRGIGAAMPCPVRVYDNGEHDEALAWLASLPRCVDVSIRDTAKAFIGGTLAAVGSLGGLVTSTGIKNGHSAR